MPDNRRRNLRSDKLSTWMVNNDADATLLTTRVSEGPATVQDRYVDWFEFAWKTDAVTNLHEEVIQP